ncbi:MAG: hypothetical protein KH230_13705 [Enterocloster asparagiformis]|nr:hypothetical protein [Enterocloster asparagiformis]
MNENFKKDSLEDITYEHFEATACTAMTTGYKEIAPIGIPIGEDYLLYGTGNEVKRESLITVRNYCGTLELLVTDKNGRLLVYSEINGLPPRETIQELYREFLVVKHLVDTETEPSFPWQMKLRG